MSISVSRRKLLVKSLALVGFSVAAVFVLSSSIFREIVVEKHELRTYLEAYGTAAPLLFVMLSALLVGFGGPRVLVYPLGGFIFGFYSGLGLAMAGTVTGAYLNFIFIRWGGREIVLNKWPSLIRMTEVFNRRGVFAVFLVRMLPLPGLLLNALLALTPTRHGAFLIGTILGFLPIATPAAMIGAGSAEMFAAGTGVWRIIMATALLVGIWVVSAKAIGERYFLNRFYCYNRKGSFCDP